MIEVKIVKNEELGLWEGTATLNLPSVTVTKFKARKDDLCDKYGINGNINTVITQQIIDAARNEAKKIHRNCKC